jgi:hypothetical protein
VIGDGRDQVEVDPLIDHAVVAEDRIGPGHQIGGPGDAVHGLRKVLGLNAGREAMGVRMTAPAGFVQAWAAGEDEIRLMQQGRFLGH